MASSQEQYIEIGGLQLNLRLAGSPVSIKLSTTKEFKDDPEAEEVCGQIFPQLAQLIPSATMDYNGGTEATFSSSTIGTEEFNTLRNALVEIARQDQLFVYQAGMQEPEGTLNLNVGFDWDVTRQAPKAQISFNTNEAGDYAPALQEHLINCLHDKGFEGDINIVRPADDRITLEYYNPENHHAAYRALGAMHSICRNLQEQGLDQALEYV